MADQYTELKRTGYGTRITNSLAGILIGILLFFIAVGILFTNEGRVNVSNIARTATEISSDKANTDTALNGKLVSTTGLLTSVQPMGDDLFLKPGKYIAINRKVEMYSWTEEKSSKKKKELGGAQTEEITYNYKKKWTESPAPASDLKYPEGHTNPAKAFDSAQNKAAEAKVGVYDIDLSMIGLPSFSPLQLSPAKVELKSGAMLAGSRFVFSGKGTINNPQVGDLRASYTVLPAGARVTVFGKLSDNMIAAYLDQKNYRLYRMFSGSRDEAIASLQTEFKIMMWAMRLLGFLLMWAGLALFVEPLSVILDVLPLLGTVNRFVFNAITFIVALIVSVIIIIISMIVHNLLILLILLAAIFGGLVWSAWQRKKK